MRKYVFLIILALVSIPVLSQQAQNGGTASSDYTIALMKKNNADIIKAFEGYIKKYPDTSNKYTKYAYYWLSISYFKAKKLSKAISYGLKSEKLGGLDNSMKAQLMLVLSSSYASKGNFFNKDKAISYANKTIKIAKSKKILNSAKRIKKKLSTPPKPSETPSQKIKRLYGDEDFEGVISTYRTLKGADKTSETLHIIYTNALFKNMNYKKAITEFKKIYSSNKKGKYAKKIADCNSELSKLIRSKKNFYLNEAIKYYIESGILYGRELNKSNKRNAILLAKNLVYKKYNLQRKIAAYNRKLKNNKSSASKNKKAIKKAQRELARFKRYLRREYRGMTPPEYEIKKKKKLERKIRVLKSGGGVKSNNDSAVLNAEIKKADAELENLIKQAKARL